MHLLLPALTCMACLNTTAPGMSLWEAHRGHGAQFSLPVCQKMSRLGGKKKKKFKSY